MLALALAVVLTASDSLGIPLEIDVDTIDLVADVDGLDWLSPNHAALRITSVQRDTMMRGLSHRIDVSLNKTTAGCNTQTPNTTLVPTGYWCSTQADGVTCNIGDIGLFAGSGLLLGTASAGMRSLRSLQMPQDNRLFVRAWKSRNNLDALRGGGLCAVFDSSRSQVGIFAGRSLRDSSSIYGAMAALRLGTFTVGGNLIGGAAIHESGLSCWFQIRQQAYRCIAEFAVMGMSQPALQVVYTRSLPSMRLGSCFWICGPNSRLLYGSLVAISSTPKNTWGAVLTSGHTVRSLFGWNAWLSVEGSYTRTFETPFPTLDYAARFEIRQTITSQLHATWRISSTRDDDGITIDGIRTQQPYFRIGLQSNIERIVSTTLRWRLNTDVRWLWATVPVSGSATLRCEAIWKPHAGLTLRARASHFSSPNYRIASRTIDYVSPSLLRMVVFNGNGMRFSVGASWSPLSQLQISALATATYMQGSRIFRPELWLAVTTQVSQAPDRHLLREESVWQSEETSDYHTQDVQDATEQQTGMAFLQAMHRPIQVLR